MFQEKLPLHKEKKISVRDDVVYPLWNDGAVIFKYEPLDVMGPETLLFYSLGLDQQALALVVYINKDAPDTIHPCIFLSIYMILFSFTCTV